jgi:lysozyme family protein
MPPVRGDRFAVCLTETLRWEGGYSNDPHDSGGATMRGVIQRVYDGFRDSRRLHRRDVRQLEPAELQAIYHANYWQLVRGDELPPGVDLATFDYGVNSGPSRAIKGLQKILGVAQDGHLGAATLAAVHRANPAELVAKIMAERRRFIRQIGVYWRFGKGWERRCTGVERVALGMAGQGVWQADVVAFEAPLADMNAQSAEQGRAVSQPPSPPALAETVTGGGGIIGIFREAFASMRAMTWQEFAFALLSSPSFWISVTAVVGAVYIFLWRRKHQEHVL